jgi:hypothetical protein
MLSYGSDKEIVHIIHMSGENIAFLVGIPIFG